MADASANLELPRLLLVDWIRSLAIGSGLTAGQWGSNDGAVTFEIGGSTVTAKFIADQPLLHFSCDQPQILAKVKEFAVIGVERIRQRDFENVVWYSTTVVSKDFEISSPHAMGMLFERLGNQTRILGKRRLGVSVLLEFSEVLPKDWDESKVFLAPQAKIDIHIPSPTPIAGEFGSRVASAAVELAVNAATLALGRPVSLPIAVRLTPAEKVANLEESRFSTEILNLARKGVSLDVFEYQMYPGGLDVTQRLRRALLTYDAAIDQPRSEIACILYVATAESLVAPNTAWRDSKLTTRFVKFFEDLIADDLDKIVGHGNFESVFEISRGTRTPKALRKELLTAIYDYRSSNLHAGLKPGFKGFLYGMEGGREVRRALFADFAEAAILGYLKSPRSSLEGHPLFSKTASGTG